MTWQACALTGFAGRLGYIARAACEGKSGYGNGKWEVFFKF